MRRSIIRTIAAGAVLIALWWITPSAAMEQVPVGPRALGMAGAFLSLADDASALFWNPAGLAYLERQEILGTHAKLYRSGTTDDYVSFVLPLSPALSAAADWYRSGFDDEELDFAENRFDLACGAKIWRRISLGATLKYITRSVDLDGTTVRDGRGFGADLGLLVKPLPGLSLGAVAHDLFGTSLHYEDEGSSLVYGRSFRGGASYTLSGLGSVALDVDDRYHLGVEVSPLPIVAIRAGIEDDREGGERLTPTFGAGVKVRGFRFDYALVDHPLLGSTSHFGLSAAFNFNPARIKIEKVDAKPVYTSLHRSYAHEPLGTVRLRNLEAEPIHARMSVFVPDLMDSPSEQDVVLRPLTTQELPLTAVFSDRVMELQGDRMAPVHVAITYQSRRLMRTEKKSASSMVLAPGAINWSAGVGQAAAFVTTRDPIVDSFVRDAVRSVYFMERDAFGNRHIAFAAAVMDALGVLGVVYVPDPNQPYSTIPDSPKVVDTIQYPRQTLERRTGDCDDTSVLVASMLAHLGVRTKFVDVPGHLFLLASTGVHARNRLSLGVSEELHVVSDDEVWIPLETTVLQLGFAEAWRRGAEEYANRAARERLVLFDVGEYQSRYEPAETRGIHFASPTVDTDGLRARLAHDARTIDSWRREYVTSQYGDVQRGSSGATPGALNQLAHVYFTASQWTESRRRLEALLAQEPASARARNNLAITHIVQGDLQGAARYLESAAAADSSDPGIWLNLGLTRDLAGDTLSAQSCYKRTLILAGGLAPAADLVGLRLRQGTPVGGTVRDADVGAFLKALREDVSLRWAAAEREQPAAPGQITTPAEKRSQPQGWSAARGSALQELLYWKD